MLLRQALYEVRLSHVAHRARIQCEMAMIQAISDKAEFTIIGFHEGKMIACYSGHWIEV